MENNINKVSIRLVKDSTLITNEKLDSPQKVADIIGGEFRDMDREVFCVVNLNTQLQPINYTFCSLGTINRSLVSPRELFKAAILSNAASMIIMHNHPSSVLDPSEEDILITKKLHGLCAMMSIPLQDHIIVGPEDNTYYSFKEHNIIVTENPDYEFALFAAEKNRAR